MSATKLWVVCKWVSWACGLGQSFLGDYDRAAYCVAIGCFASLQVLTESQDRTRSPGVITYNFVAPRSGSTEDTPQ